MTVIKGIKSGIDKGDSNQAIARKIFLSYTTEIFKENQDAEFYIKNSISTAFDIPFSSIEIVGSGKTGLSFFKDKPFEPGVSDLDIAVISLPLYNKFCEISHEVSRGYGNLEVFPIYKGQRTDKQFIKSLKNGFINPFFMPKSEMKSKWLDFFNSLSNGYFELFKNINGGIYSSEYFFEYKQTECIEEYIKNPKKYDEISS